MKLNITKEDKMLRCACIDKLGITYSLNGTKDEIDLFLLEIEGRNGIKAYKILDKDTKEIIETQDGMRTK
jgi:predicted transcriptional regulator with HTH domain